jgi:hypothetical protein
MPTQQCRLTLTGMKSLTVAYSSGHRIGAHSTKLTYLGHTASPALSPAHKGHVWFLTFYQTTFCCCCKCTYFLLVIIYNNNELYSSKLTVTLLAPS